MTEPTHEPDEYARIDDPRSPCPKCHKPLAFASRFKKFGRQHVQVCRHCKTVWLNGRNIGAVEVGK